MKSLLYLLGQEGKIGPPIKKIGFLPDVPKFLIEAGG
jgi:hypothetical protein